ncbi:MAG: hypothetical protein U9N52_07515 [Campylobacterota bacterium]|nr:hypothetical protein [Campylobacterota bacterium]
MKTIDALFAYDSRRKSKITTMRRLFKDDEVSVEEKSRPSIPEMDENFSLLHHDELMKNYAQKISQMNTNRRSQKLFSSKDEKLMNELQRNALKLERARRGQ